MFHPTRHLNLWIDLLESNQEIPMRFSREHFTLKKMMWAIGFLALILTVVLQEARIRSGRAREEQLRTSLTEAEARTAWANSIDEWKQVGNSSALKKQWADGLRRANALSDSP
jgi:hypothetical protein